MTYAKYCEKCKLTTRHFRDSHPTNPDECLDCLRENERAGIEEHKDYLRGKQ